MKRRIIWNNKKYTGITWLILILTGLLIGFIGKYVWNEIILLRPIGMVIIVIGDYIIITGLDILIYGYDNIEKYL